MKSNNYIDQLTWLRGFAAFLVIISHTLRATEVSYGVNDKASYFFPMNALDLGSFGVALFFTLSGCTLFISHSGQMGKKDIIGFYLKRFFRIWPAFFVSFLIYIIFGMIFKHFYTTPKGFWIEKQFLESYSMSDVISYLTLTFNMTGNVGLFNNAFWSLPVEFQYYLLFPFLLISINRISLITPIIIAVILYFIPKIDVVFFASMQTMFNLAFTFCGGVIIGKIFTGTTWRINNLVGIFILILSIATVSLISNKYILLPDIPIVSNHWNWYGGISIIVVFISLFTTFFIHPKIAKRLKHFGTISYSSYLYHNLFIGVSVLFITNFGLYGSHLKLWITFTFTICMTFFCASVSYLYIEKPFIELSRTLNRKLQNNYFLR